ncbi:MAG: TetR/AcrR family transcriptional regulator [Gammaproteobacteria bacterium]|nr:TetR/AcrR family transcriptional regulator [Gammaproteobacteria bacterium]MBU2279527.1 TetR/AcrR family transcriptional regulator [Gammaproteobacteria bacterium]
MTGNANTIGRPRAFDVDKALQKALEVFWEKGYEGTSLPDLTEAMGINKPSLYAAFGNKEQLFLKAIELYENRPCGFFQPALLQPTAYQMAEHLLFGAAISSSDPSNPKGCLMVQGALSCSDNANSVKQMLIEKRRSGELQLQQRLEKAQAEGDLAADADCAALACFLVVQLHGMSIQAASGATAERLQQVAVIALKAFAKAALQQTATADSAN